MKLKDIDNFNFLLPGVALAVFAGIVIVFSCTRTDKSGAASEWDKDTLGHNRFVGDQTCRGCHEWETREWKGSHHDYAMKKADGESVRGDFGDVSFTHGGESYRFFRRDSLYMVEAPGPDGVRVQYRITHTFGWTPLQQYLVDFGDGKLQALNVAWDTERERWFALNPGEKIRHGDWLHWTGGAMNWNTMCADCHSTNLRQNYIAEADSFHTTWSSINVSCEACHGPGNRHVEFMQSDAAAEASVDRIREDLKMTSRTSQVELVNRCSRCHALREKLTDNYDHKGEFLDHFNPTLPHPEAYFADGQIREEVYVYGSFLQSRMYKMGVKCSDCHDPHSLELKANVMDNSLCMQCHEPRYNTRTHFRHPVNTEASQCISCHMPGRYYMEVDFRRDHSFRVPRPDISAEFGTPNACNSCHEDRPASWAAEAVEQWYGAERPAHFSEALVRADSLGPDALPRLEQLVSDTGQPAIARATAVWYLGQFPGTRSMDLLEVALNDEEGLVRKSAVRAMATLPADMKLPVLQDALDDSLRSVRLGAVEGLAEFSPADMAFNLKQPFNRALEEYRQYLDANRYFPLGQMNRGQFFERQGELERAADAYRRALQKDPFFNPARINLAYLYNRQGRNAEAEELLRKVIEQEPAYGPAYYSLALLMAEQDRLEASIPMFEKAAALMPDNARVRYNWAIALQTLDRPSAAEAAYLKAIELAPENPDYRYGICTLYLQQEQYRKALPHARELAELQPGNQRIQQLLQMVEEGLGK